MADIAALKTELETNMVYDANVTGGHNGKLAVQLNTDNSALTRRWRPIPVDDFLNAIAGETLTTQQEERIRTYVVNNDTVPTHKPAVRQWMQANFSTTAVTTLRALAEVTGKPADAFLSDGEDRLALNDVRAAVAQIAKAYINQ